MRKNYSCCLLLLLTCCSLPNTGLAAQPERKFSFRLQISVMLATVRISDPITGKTGSGVLIGNKGNEYYVLTARHIVTGVRSPCLTVYTLNSFPRPASTYNNSQLLSQDKEQDLAVIRFTAAEKTYPVLPLCTNRNTPVATNFSGLVTGFVGNNKPEKKIIRVIGKKRIRLPGQAAKWAWEITPEQPVGYSGGPLVSKSGQLIGIASGSNNGKGYYAYTSEIHRFLKQNSLQWLSKEEK